jgi:hypothetical protein
MPTCSTASSNSPHSRLGQSAYDDWEKLAVEFPFVRLGIQHFGDELAV